MSEDIEDMLSRLWKVGAICPPRDPSPPIFYRQPTWYDRGGWTWNYTTGSPQGRVDFTDRRWLHLLDGWVISGHEIRKRD